MNGKDKISVIIPCYNVQKYIMRCFDSIYSQTNLLPILKPLHLSTRLAEELHLHLLELPPVPRTEDEPTKHPDTRVFPLHR